MQYVASHGLSIAVREYDAPPGVDRPPHVVLVHGYPDNQRMWEPVAERLRGAGMQVVTYDVRGAGASDVPPSVDGYATDRLVDDLVAVLDATVPEGEQVHLVGHDWGSVQLWEAVLAESRDPRLRGRIASFVSASGPALDHMAYLARNPQGRRLRMLGQLGSSWYVGFFQLPFLPELMWRTAHRPIAALASLAEPGADGDHWGPELARDAANGVNLYRANVSPRLRRPRRRHTDVPVRVLAPRRDPYLRSVTVEDLDHLCSRVSVERPDAGHWLPRSHPDLFADLVREHVTAHA